MLSALSLTAMAEEKKTIVIQLPTGGTAMMANMIKNQLVTAFATSEEWQPIEQPSEEEMNRRMLAGEPVGNLQTAQYILTTEMQEVFGEFMISCKIIEIETALMMDSAKEMCKPSPQSILQASTEIAKQLLEKKER